MWLWHVLQGFSRGSPFFLPFSLPLLFCCPVRRRLLFCADTAGVLLERCSIFVPAFSVQLQHDSISSCPDSLFMQLFTIDSVVSDGNPRRVKIQDSRTNFQEPKSGDGRFNFGDSFPLQALAQHSQASGPRFRQLEECNLSTFEVWALTGSVQPCRS
jgi:hypothetical protein